MIRIIFLLMLFGLTFSTQAYTQKSTTLLSPIMKSDKFVLLKSNENFFYKISIEKDEIVRIQSSINNNFDSSLAVQKGFVKADFPAVKFSVKENKTYLTIITQKLRLEINKSTFSFRLLKSNGELLTATLPDSGIIVRKNGGSKLHLQMANDEHFFGFGFMRAAFDARGSKLTWERAYRWKEATVPFFMSTHNFGFYSNNTWNHTFDFTNSTNYSGLTNSYSISNVGGDLDFYFFVGDDLKQVLSSYCQLTGFPQLIPNWALSIQYRCRYMENQENVLKIALKFRELDIPAGVIGLEPGWESEPYSDKLVWSSERFPNPQAMIKDLNRLGFHFDLWESGMAPYKNILDSNVLSNWYLKKSHLIKMGVESFKLDDPYPRSISSEAYDNAIYRSGLIESGVYKHNEIKNIANSVFSESAFNGYRSLTGKRPVIQFHAYNASVASHRWSYQWGGDFLSGTGMLNAGLSGHAVVSEDLRDFSPKGIHYSFLTPVPVLDAWAYYREPWSFSYKIEKSQRFYARFRQKLQLYLYSTLWQSHNMALPMMRAMILEYPKDTAVYNMKSQFMMGDWLLVVANPSKVDEADRAVFDINKNNSSVVYLPKGEWINYWTGETYFSENGKNIKVNWPNYAGGALLVKAGAILPISLSQKFTNQRPDNLISFEIFPSQSSEYILYEDDGISLDYERGQSATTQVKCVANKNKILIQSVGRKGSYKNMPVNRVYLLKVKCDKPVKILNTNKPLPELRTKEELLYSLSSGWFYDDEEQKLFIKNSSNWRLVKSIRDERNNSLSYELDEFESISNDSNSDTSLDVLIFTTKNSLSKQEINSNTNKKAIETPVTTETTGVKLTMKTNPEEEVLLVSGTYVHWLLPKVDVFVRLELDGKPVETIQNKEIVLNVYDENRKLLKSYSAVTVDGEAVFTAVDYYNRPGKCYFVASASGYADVELKIFENTWDYEMVKNKLVKKVK